MEPSDHLLTNWKNLEPTNATFAEIAEQNDIELTSLRMNRPITDLDLSVRSYRCLEHAGVDTIGQLLSALPRGYSAVRGAGPKTWQEIENAVSDFLWDKTPNMKHQKSTTGSSFHLDSGATTQGDNRIENPRVLADLVDPLRRLESKAIHNLAQSSLSQIVRTSELNVLTHEDWANIALKIKYSRSRDHKKPMMKHAEPSFLALKLSARLFNCLARTGIVDLGTLLNCTLEKVINIRNFGPKSLAELIEKLRAALDIADTTLDNMTSLPSEPEAQIPQNARTDVETPVVTPTTSLRYESSEVDSPGKLNLDKLLNQWFAGLDARQLSVLQWRYGLTNERALTYQEIGERLGVTRERARQLEQKALQHLMRSPRLGQVRMGQVRVLVSHIHDVIVNAGGATSEEELGRALSEMAEVGEYNPQTVIRLVMERDERVKKIKGTKVWCLAHLRALVPLVDEQAISILSSARAPLRADEFLSQFMATRLYQQHRDTLNDQFIMACARINEKIVQREDDSLGLQIWDRHWQDDIIIALRRLGQPTHYAAIADAINASQTDGQHVTAKAVHIRLMQHPDIFVWIGRKGTYGLSEWGIERAPTYVDVLSQVLQDAGHPLTIPQILAALVKLRPYYDDTSVQLTLGTNSRFCAFPGNTFGLAEWQEEDFASNDYRLQRLFENSEMATTRSTKPEVFEAINGVDGFIARIREDGEYARYGHLDT